jgi:hypothetical protein
MSKEAMNLALEHAKRDERHMNHAETRYWCRMYRDMAEKAIEALAEQPAQQEPVAALQRVMARLADLLDEDQFAEIEGIVARSGVAPPAQRKPLTLREIGAVCGNFSNETIKVVRQTEAAHGIKENT